MIRREEKYQHANHLIKEDCLLLILYISHFSLIVPKADFLTRNTSICPKSSPAKAVTICSFLLLAVYAMTTRGVQEILDLPEPLRTLWLTKP